VYDVDNNKYRSPSDLIVVLGNTNRYERDNNTLSIRASKIVGHSEYDPDTYENNVALIVLSEEVPADHPTAKPIRLSNSTATASQKCEISGWGTIPYVGFSYSCELHSF